MHPPQGPVIFADNKLFSFLRYRSCQNNNSTFPLRFAARSRHTAHRTSFSVSQSIPVVSLSFCVCDVSAFHFYHFICSFCCCCLRRCVFCPCSPLCVCVSAFTVVFSLAVFPSLAASFLVFPCALCTVTSIL